MSDRKQASTKKKSALSYRTKGFNKLFEALPNNIKSLAKSKYDNFFLDDPFHDLLRGKEVLDQSNGTKSWSISINREYRALAIKTVNDGRVSFVWYWIGSHEDYNNRM